MPPSRCTASKEESTTGCEMFDIAMRDRAVSRLRVETDMRQAIERGAFEVHYQPIVAIRGGTLAGFEALVRWRHPTQGLIDPAEFIPIAEDTEMIVLIGRQVLAQSCRQMVEWQQQFGTAAPRVMCVNVSSKQFADDDLISQVQNVLQESGLHPSSLKLEITESAFLGDFRRAQMTLRRLADARRRLEPGRFRDRLFVAELPPPPACRHGQGRSILREPHRASTRGRRWYASSPGIAHNMGMDVVAEGVETVDQLEWLRAIGCEYAQGYYFSRPVDVTTATGLIASAPWRADSSALPGNAVQLQMWPPEPRFLRVS